MNDVNKFVWAYMLEVGERTNGTWSYYGSRFEGIKNDGLFYNYEKAIKEMDTIKNKVKEIGIDWDKTLPPKSNMESSFEGTFADSSEVETLLGELVLKNGSRYTIGVSNADKRFSGYLTSLSHFMEDQQRVKDILGE